MLGMRGFLRRTFDFANGRLVVIRSGRWSNGRKASRYKQCLTFKPDSRPAKLLPH